MSRTEELMNPDPPARGAPVIRTIGPEAIVQALRAGWSDFRRAPRFGLAFAATYVLGGLALWYIYARADEQLSLLAVVLGFPLIGPFAATGLYEVSRRLDRGQRLDWRGVLTVLAAQRNRQLPSLAAVVLVFFLFWMFVAHTLFALFLGLSPGGQSAALGEFMTSRNGILLLLVGGSIGTAFAAGLFAVTVIGLPVLLDREIDFVSAMILSVDAVAANPLTMALWGLLISALSFAAMLPGFLGLLVVLPLLGHASWHMYRLTVAEEAAPQPGEAQPV